jgi:hypothetical protein
MTLVQEKRLAKAHTRQGRDERLGQRSGYGLCPTGPDRDGYYKHLASFGMLRLYTVALELALTGVYSRSNPLLLSITKVLTHLTRKISESQYVSQPIVQKND